MKTSFFFFFSAILVGIVISNCIDIYSLKHKTQTKDNVVQGNGRIRDSLAAVAGRRESLLHEYQLEVLPNGVQIWDSARFVSFVPWNGKHQSGIDSVILEINK